MVNIVDNWELTGSVERVTFHNPENGFCVLKIKAKGNKDLVVVLGNCADIVVGEYIEASGKWINNLQYGMQFQANTIKNTPPTLLLGIEKYLGSGLIKGIGKSFAKKLVANFGVDVLVIIEHNPNELLSLTGIGEHRKNMIVESWSRQKSVREIILFLHEYNIGSAKATKI